MKVNGFFISKEIIRELYKNNKKHVFLAWMLKARVQNLRVIFLFWKNELLVIYFIFLAVWNDRKMTDSRKALLEETFQRKKNILDFLAEIEPQSVSNKNFNRNRLTDSNYCALLTKNGTIKKENLRKEIKLQSRIKEKGTKWKKKKKNSC